MGQQISRNYDIEYQFYDKDIWIRFNDIEADNEDRAYDLAEQRLLEEFGEIVQNWGSAHVECVHVGEEE